MLENYIESIRKRPAMYVGSTDFFGFIHYLVCPVAIMLSQAPTRVSVRARDGGFEVESDVPLPIEELSDGRIAPFQQISKLKDGYSYEATVLNALSDSLRVESAGSDQIESLVFKQGNCEFHRVFPRHSDSPRPGSKLTFAPDDTILKVTSASPAIFQSYLRRLSFLHRGMRFSLTIGEDNWEYFAESGIAEMFHAVSAPYQIMHEPFHILEQEDTRCV